MSLLKRYLPVLDWGRHYGASMLGDDLLAAVIVTIMLIPQSLAYALLAGLPPEMGLYASILPLVAYAVFGTSRALSVGPVAVVSLMTATAIAQLGLSDPQQVIAAAIALALMSGLMLVLMGLLRLGFLANFLSHPVISGFITASGLLIGASQLRHLLGVSAEGHTLVQMLGSLWQALPDLNLITTIIGVLTTAFLFWVRGGLKPLLVRVGLRPGLADVMARAGPIVAVASTTALAWALSLETHGVALVGSVPTGLPPLGWPGFDAGLWAGLAGSALLISIIGFVESISVAHTLAAQRRQRIDPDQELIGLGAANLASAVSAGYPVTGGFSRSVVNFDAGAATPAAGAFTAAGIALAALFLTPYLYYLPKATLAATILVAVLSLVDLSIVQRAWRYSKSDFAAVATTILVTLSLGVELGVSTGVAASIVLFLYKTSRPHIAEVGCVPGTEHFRNVLRHQVETVANVLTLRMDMSLYFANARYLEDYLYARVVDDCALTDVILMCSAVNEIDLSALESLEAIDQRLQSMNIRFHLSEVKGPVMDRLQDTHFLQHLSGRVFLSQFHAVRALANPPTSMAGPDTDSETDPPVDKPGIRTA